MDILSFVLKSVQLGAIGVVAVALAFSYLLLKGAMKQPVPVPVLETIKSYMRVCLYLAAMSGVFQIADTIMTKVTSNPSRDTAMITAETLMLNQGTWHWHYGKGNWETVARFVPAGNGTFEFAANTRFKRADSNGGAVDVEIIRWRSTQPFALPAKGADNLTFSISKEVLSGASAWDSTLLPGVQNGTASFSMGKSLLGTYGGPVSEDRYPRSNMILYLPPGGE